MVLGVERWGPVFEVNEATVWVQLHIPCEECGQPFYPGQWARSFFNAMGGHPHHDDCAPPNVRW